LAKWKLLGTARKTHYQPRNGDENSMLGEGSQKGADVAVTDSNHLQRHIVPLFKEVSVLAPEVESPVRKKQFDSSVFRSLKKLSDHTDKVVASLIQLRFTVESILWLSCY